MKYLKLYEQFRLILEATGKRCVLVDGTSSAGKSYMTEGLKDKGWIVIASDDFHGDSEMKIPFDHAGDGYDKEAGEEFHKLMLKERGPEMGAMGSTTVAWNGEDEDGTKTTPHPKNEEFRKISDGDHRVWYMYQDYLYGRGKNATGVIFDDISDEILRFVPNCQYILLYSPLETLKRNVIGRAKKNDRRGEWVFSDQFLKRFEATENKEDSIDKEGVYTKESLKELLSDKDLQDAFNEGDTLDVDKFIDDLGVKEDGKEYYIKLRNFKEPEFFNTRNKTPKDLEKNS